LLAGLIMWLRLQAGKTDPLHLLRRELARLRGLEDNPEKLVAAERWLRHLLARHWGDVVFTLSANELAKRLAVQTDFPAMQAAQSLLEAAERYKFGFVTPAQADIQRLTRGLTTCWQVWSLHPPHPSSSPSESIASSISPSCTLRGGTD
jgi:hypothetical protein